MTIFIVFFMFTDNTFYCRLPPTAGPVQVDVVCMYIMCQCTVVHCVDICMCRNY